MCGISYSFVFISQLLQKLVYIVKLYFFDLPKMLDGRVGFDGLYFFQVNLLIYLLILLLFYVHLCHYLMILLYLQQVVPKIEYLFLVISEHNTLLHNLRSHVILQLPYGVLILLLKHHSDLINRFYLSFQSLILLFQQTNCIRKSFRIVIAKYLCSLFRFNYLLYICQLRLKLALDISNLSLSLLFLIFNTSCIFPCPLKFIDNSFSLIDLPLPASCQFFIIALELCDTFLKFFTLFPEDIFLFLETTELYLNVRFLILLMIALHQNSQLVFELSELIGNLSIFLYIRIARNSGVCLVDLFLLQYLQDQFVVALLILGVDIFVCLKIVQQIFLYLCRLDSVEELVYKLDMHFLAEIEITLKLTDTLFIKTSRIEKFLDGFIEHFVFILKICILGLQLFLNCEPKTERFLYICGGRWRRVVPHL